MNKIYNLRESKQTIYFFTILSLVVSISMQVNAQQGSQVASAAIHFSITVGGNSPEASIGLGIDKFSEFFNSESYGQNLDGEKSDDVKLGSNLGLILNHSISEQTEFSNKTQLDIAIENRFVNQIVGTSTILDTRGRLYIHQEQGRDIPSTTKNKSQQLQNGLMVVAVNE